MFKYSSRHHSHSTFNCDSKNNYVKNGFIYLQQANFPNMAHLSNLISKKKKALKKQKLPYDSVLKTIHQTITQVVRNLKKRLFML